MFGLQSAEILPAILIGWELNAGHLPAGPLDMPSWVITLDHEYGGHTAEEYGGSPHATMVGAVLRLEANLRHGRGEMRELIERLRDGQDRQRHFHDRSAEGFGAERFRQLQETVRQYLRAPEIERDSNEALVRFQQTDPLNHFEGWAALSPEAAEPLRFSDELTVDEALVEELKRMGPALTPAPLRSFLLWQNCDL